VAGTFSSIRQLSLRVRGREENFLDGDGFFAVWRSELAALGPRVLLGNSSIALSNLECGTIRRGGLTHPAIKKANALRLASMFDASVPQRFSFCCD
jgi:hypothetical protein